MSKFLDYDGLSLYDKLIKKLITSGDTELLEQINELKDIIGVSDGSDMDKTIIERLSSIESTMIDSHMWDEFEQ